jgi:hypothetical protein
VAGAAVAGAGAAVGAAVGAAQPYTPMVIKTNKSVKLRTLFAMVFMSFLLA